MPASVRRPLAPVRVAPLLAALCVAGGFAVPDAVIGTAEAYEAKGVETLRRETGERWAALGFETRMMPVNGVELHVATAGVGDPVLLLHGYPQSGEIWREVAPELAKTHEVIVVDLRGFGLSSLADDGYALSNVTEDLHQLVGVLGHDEVKVLAHDWGGAVGATYALRYRDEVSKLVFIESALAGAGFEDTWSFTTENPKMTFVPFLLSGELTSELMEGREELFLEHLWDVFTVNKEGAPFSDWAPYVEALKRPGLIDSTAGYYRAVYDEIDATRALIAEGKLEIPVLSLSGAGSFGDLQEQFVQAFADNVVEHVTVESAGHFVVEEQPEAVLAEVTPFLAD